MTRTAVLRTFEADALTLRMRRHFGHKVTVELVDGVSRVTIDAGSFELEPRHDRLVVRAVADDEARLERVEEVAGSHLVRFAREPDVELDWRSLEARAEEWLASYRNWRHVRRTRDWVVVLSPGADEALRLAALLHDVDRTEGRVPLAEQVASWADPAAIRRHSEGSAAVATRWLRDAGADSALAARVADLVLLHEVGGNEEADVLQAADSLSFLETSPAARWVGEGLASPGEAARKLRHMHDRIRVDRARELAAPLLERALAGLGREPSALDDSALALRVRQQTNEGRAHGNTG